MYSSSLVHVQNVLHMIFLCFVYMQFKLAFYYHSNRRQCKIQYMCMLFMHLVLIYLVIEDFPFKQEPYHYKIIHILRICSSCTQDFIILMIGLGLSERIILTSSTHCSLVPSMWAPYWDLYYQTNRCVHICFASEGEPPYNIKVISQQGPLP